MSPPAFLSQSHSSQNISVHVPRTHPRTSLIEQDFASQTPQFRFLSLEKRSFGSGCCKPLLLCGFLSLSLRLITLPSTRLKRYGRGMRDYTETQTTAIPAYESRTDTQARLVSCISSAARTCPAQSTTKNHHLRFPTRADPRQISSTDSSLFNQVVVARCHYKQTLRSQMGGSTEKHGRL